MNYNTLVTGGQQWAALYTHVHKLVFGEGEEDTGDREGPPSSLELGEGGQNN